MSHPRRRTPPGLLVYPGLFLAAMGCDPSCIRGDDPTLDCDARTEEFEDAVAEEGVLLDAIPESASFPMALVISEEGINKLLTGVVGGNNTPFASKLPLGPVEIQFTPTSDPVIDFISVPGCSKCVVFTLDFSFELVNPSQEAAGAGLGATEMVIPLRLEQLEGDTSALIADYAAATVRDMSINVSGFDSETYPGLAGALAILSTEQLRANYGKTELIRFEPWTIGTNAVKLAAKQFAIFPEANVLSLGLQTNLQLPKAASIDVGRALPEGVPMAVQMHPLLLLGMAERMITEDVIARRYNDKGEPDPEGAQGVTLTSIEKAALGDTNLDVQFRVWRTDEGYCGYVDAVNAIELSLDDAGFQDRIAVTPAGDVRILGGLGVGELFEDNKDLVEKNKNLVENFRDSLSEQIGITVNYSDLQVEGGTIVFDALALQVASGSIDIFLDFLVLANEGG